MENYSPPFLGMVCALAGFLFPLCFLHCYPGWEGCFSCLPLTSCHDFYCILYLYAPLIFMLLLEGIMNNHFNVSIEFHRQYMATFMDMGMLLMVHTLLPLPQFQQLMVRCLVRSIISIQLRIFSLLHQFLLPLKEISSLLSILRSQQLKLILPRQRLMVFLMVLLTVTAELYPLRQATKIHH